MPRQRGRTYGASRVALIVLWDASDRLCSKRLVAMIPFLLPALERHGKLKLSADERSLVLKVSAATIDRLLSDVKIAAAGGTPTAGRLFQCRTAAGPGAHIQ